MIHFLHDCMFRLNIVIDESLRLSQQLSQPQLEDEPALKPLLVKNG